MKWVYEHFSCVRGHITQYSFFGPEHILVSQDIIGHCEHMRAFGETEDIFGK